ncbi:hypothetical protein [Mucilaginibacter jinjuensis]|uniref:Uncharacterized protein n=1 Tax=Mucilaginibacter jinjuensis TaxID=1176721 RepID=A0ABY7TBG5_9SPHI|nr:hypothetical protein [Mucilaginibacter jinjuensis]WCT13543.1 hypothetical protein PQO05_06285 [Mucilaginibacter jinjuensis]
MNRVRKNSTQKASSKWLYLAVLLLTLLSVSGLAIPGQAQLFAQQTTKAASKPKAIKKCITYKRAVAQVEVRKVSDWLLLLFDIDLSALHTQQCKAKNCCAFTPASGWHFNFFYQAKTIPQSNSDEPAIRLG